MAVGTPTSEGAFVLHGKTYKLPTRPTVVVCIDGFDPTYLESGAKSGTLSAMPQFLKTGFHVTAESAMPSFTNPNNVSIITGVPTSVHGIAGNYYLDSKTGKEVMVVDDTLLRGSTILAELAQRGTRVAAITAKDKLRRILAHGLTEDNSVCYSAECASDETLQWLGREARPSQYSAELSLFVLDAGLKLLLEGKADVLYLTLSDFVQHKHAPGSPAADEFMGAIDARIKSFVELGAVVAVTGDHGMNDKSIEEGAPNVLFLQDVLEEKFGEGCARVICPITDPFVKHHGALGGFVRVHVAASHMSKVDEMVAYAATFPQVEAAMPKIEAVKRCETPMDVEGDFAVASKANAVVGSKASEHDLSNLEGHRLRSHGGFSEQEVPLLMSTPVKDDDGLNERQWRNFDIFDLVLNHGQ
ncbi:Phosphonoacetate hydrolase [Sarocladium strictum]